MSATTAVYDGLEILCALAPNTGLRLCVRNRRSITPPPFSHWRRAKKDPSGSRRVRDARKSASERVHCCFCSSPQQANSAILVNLNQKTSVARKKSSNTSGKSYKTFFLHQYTLPYRLVSFLCWRLRHFCVVAL
jgi:hypothetical protein